MTCHLRPNQPFPVRPTHLDSPLASSEISQLFLATYYLLLQTVQSISHVSTSTGTCGAMLCSVRKYGNSNLFCSCVVILSANVLSGIVSLNFTYRCMCPCTNGKNTRKS